MQNDKFFLWLINGKNEKIGQKNRDIIFQKISRKREIFKKFFRRVTENFLP